MIFKAKIFLPILLILVSKTFVFGFNQDSVLRVISGSKDEILQIKNYIFLGSQNVSKDVKASEKYFQLGMQLNEMALASKELTPQKRNTLLSLQSEIFHDYGFFLKSNAKFREAIEYYKKSIRVQKQITDSVNESDIATSLVNIGSVLLYLEDIPNALNHFFEASKIYERIKDEEGIAFANKHISGVYVNSGNYEMAKIYIDKVVEQLRKLNTKNGLAYTLIKQANLYVLLGKKKEARNQLNVALDIFNSLNHSGGMSSALMSIGKLLESETKLDSALYFYRRAYRMIDAKKDLALYSKCNFLIGNILYKKDKFHEALQYVLTSYKMAHELGIPDEEKESAHLLSHLYSNLNNYRSAYEMQKIYELLHDSLNKKENNKKIIQKQFQFEYDKKSLADSIKTTRQKQILELRIAQQEKKEIQQRNIRNLIMVVLLAALLILIMVYRQRNKIAKAKARSEELLLNILPAEVAEELKAKGSADAKLIEEVTVLFTDFKGFTALSEKLTPKELVKDLHECFTAFDNIIQKHGLEKIKTIGDAYMAAGGLPTPNTTHAVDVVGAALEIRQFVEEGKARKISASLPYFEIRIGVHTGPVVAGIVGVKKFSYDIWGDTVNTASRMESSGEVGKVNVSETTYALVMDKFQCIPRGKIQAKGKGEIEMYFVEGQRA